MTGSGFSRPRSAAEGGTFLARERYIQQMGLLPRDLEMAIILILLSLVLWLLLAGADLLLSGYSADELGRMGLQQD
jgi:hypothetical protein